MSNNKTGGLKMNRVKSSRLIHGNGRGWSKVKVFRELSPVPAVGVCPETLVDCFSLISALLPFLIE